MSYPTTLQVTSAVGDESSAVGIESYYNTLQVTSAVGDESSAVGDGSNYNNAKGYGKVEKGKDVKGHHDGKGKQGKKGLGDNNDGSKGKHGDELEGFKGTGFLQSLEASLNAIEGFKGKGFFQSLEASLNAKGKGKSLAESEAEAIQHLQTLEARQFSQALVATADAAQEWSLETSVIDDEEWSPLWELETSAIDDATLLRQWLRGGIGKGGKCGKGGKEVDGLGPHVTSPNWGKFRVGHWASPTWRNRVWTWKGVRGRFYGPYDEWHPIDTTPETLDITDQDFTTMS